MIGPISALLAFVVLLVIIVLANAIRIVREYERLVLFRLGRLKGERGPGLVLLWPVIDRAIKVGLRTVTMDVPPQDIITKDNVSVTVDEGALVAPGAVACSEGQSVDRRTRSGRAGDAIGHAQ